MLRREVEASGADVVVASAGLRARRRPCQPATVAAAGALGIDLSEHVSAPVTPDLVRDAALVLAMERAHVVELVSGHPQGIQTCFTLPEFVRRGRAGGLPAGPAELPARVAAVARGRQPRELLGDLGRDGVPDPGGRPERVHRRVAAELDVLTREVADLLLRPSATR